MACRVTGDKWSVVVVLAYAWRAGYNGDSIHPANHLKDWKFSDGESDGTEGGPPGWPRPSAFHEICGTEHTVSIPGT